MGASADAPVGVALLLAQGVCGQHRDAGLRVELARVLVEEHALRPAMPVCQDNGRNRPVDALRQVEVRGN